MQSKQKDLIDPFDENFLQTINAGLTGQPNDPLQKTVLQHSQTQPNLFSGNNTSNSMFYANKGSQKNVYKNDGGPIPATYQKPGRSDPFNNLNWK